MIGEDLTPFFVPGEFAGHDDTLNGAPVVGILDEAYEVTNDGIGMSAVRAVYIVPAVAVPDDAEGKLLVANGKQFRVADREKSEPGVLLLILENA